SVKLLAEAVEAYKQALSVRTKEELPQQWATTQNNLAYTYLLLNDPLNTVECYVNVLTVYPKNRRAYLTVSLLTQNFLFDYDGAYRNSQKWLEHSPEDLFAQVSFAEQLFTTGRFSDCEGHLKTLLNSRNLEPNLEIVLHTVQIANSSALNKTDSIDLQIARLIELIRKQPEQLEVKWLFYGMKNFIGKHEKLSAHRAWLEKFLDTLADTNRDSIVSGLQKVQKDFK
ncbi:MAG: hypothetical protein JNN15_09530, partial [Blastocatellia bacterium]|nr:hypothetical protein [Blastocatellia bacterium]